MVNNHFDLFWRRGFHDPIIFEGKKFAAYETIHDQYIKRNLQIAGELPEYKFEVESVAVIRGVLERHPEFLEELQALAAAGRFIVSGTGDNIIDSNMVLGESLIRNYLYGLRYSEKIFKCRSYVALRLDAFGNSAQMPQIMKKCGFKRAARLTYVEPGRQYWRGLDGTEIMAVNLPEAGRAYGAGKLPPCKFCNGFGCSECDATGLTFRLVEPPEVGSIDPDPEVGEVVLLPEELLPNRKIREWFEKMREKFDVEFTLHDDQNRYFPKYAAGTPGVHSSCELNPASTGCYVSRIKLKQTARKQENALLALETLCLAAKCAGVKYPKRRIEVIWEKLFQTLFHDSVTGTTVDGAYRELRNIGVNIDRMISGCREEALKTLTRAADGKFTSLNLRSVHYSGLVSAAVPANDRGWFQVVAGDGAELPVVGVKTTGEGTIVSVAVNDLPPYSATVCSLTATDVPRSADDNPRMIENEFFRITADDGGLLEIFDKISGRAICRRGKYRPAEIIFENDEGSPWATLVDSQVRSPGVSTTFRRVEKLPGRESLFFDIRIAGRSTDSFHPLEAEMAVTLTKTQNRVDFHLAVTRYDSFNSRIRAAFPLTIAGKNYGEIPFGTLLREKYTPDFSLNGTNGDWPVVNWGGTQNENSAVALFNRGTPSYTWESSPDGEIILLSLLRSPVIPSFLHEWKEYTMTDFYTMRDAGEHAFDFALGVYGSTFDQSSVVDDAENFSAGAMTAPGIVRLPQLPIKNSGIGRISAVKIAEDQCGTVLRVAEYQGKSGVCRIGLPEDFTVCAKCDMLENIQEQLQIDNRSVTIPLEPWEIATVYLA